nr:ComEA family DNA-binding protein [Corynebacterium sp. TAE3-ERU12]
MQKRVGDLLEPIAGDETMPVDYRNQRWAVRTVAVIAAALASIAVLIGAVWWWLREPATHMPHTQLRPSANQPITGGTTAAAPAATTETEPADEVPEEIVVSVVGLVHHPSVVTLAPGSRVADAIAAAGGMLPEADIASVNQAAELSDGEQVAVGPTPLPGGGSAPGEEAPAAGSGQAGRININTAGAEELEQLPGVGPAIAESIITHRVENGPFASVDDLVEVPGIGPAKLAEIKDHVQL